MFELALWIVLLVLAILVLTGTLSGALLAWFVIGAFALIMIVGLLGGL